MELELQDKEKWLLTKPEQFSVKKSLIEAALNSLTALKAKEIIDDPKVEGDPYGLDNPQNSITLTGKKLEQTLLIGKTAAAIKDSAPGSSPNLYVKVKGHDTVYAIDEKAVKNLKTDPADLRDRSLLAINPSNIEKFEITMGGKTWLAAQGTDKIWTLEKPEKKDKVDNWAVMGMLWSLKDLEWKSVAMPDDASAQQRLETPQIVARFFKKGNETPIVLKAAWAAKEPQEQQRAEAASQDNKETTEKHAAVPDENKTPAEVNVTVQPHDEKDAIFVVDGSFVSRLRGRSPKTHGKEIVIEESVRGGSIARKPPPLN